MSEIEYAVIQSKNATHVEQRRESVEQFLSFLAAERVRRGKDGPAFIPAVFKAPQRLATNVTAITLLALDVDGWSAEVWAAYVDELEARGLGFYAWPTFSYGSKPGERWRVVFQLSRPIPVRDPWEWAHVLWPALMKFVGVGLGHGARVVDPQCRDASRLYYLRSRRAGPAMPEPITNPGAPIDVDQAVGDLLAVEQGAPDDTTREPAPVSEGKRIDPAEFLVRLEGRADAWPNGPALVACLRAGQPIPPPGRHGKILELTRMFARVATKRESLDSLYELLLPTLRAMEAERPGSMGDARRALEGARGKRERWDNERRDEKERESEAWILEQLRRAQGQQS